MSGPLTGRCALVTGGVRGIGLGIAERLVADGADVVVSSRSDADGPAAVEHLAAIRQGSRVLHTSADVRSRADVARLATYTVDRLGRLDAAVANAGIERSAPFLDVADDDWDDVMAVNLTGAFFTVQEAARCMTASGRAGRIVVIASTNAVAPESHLTAYNTSKAAVVGLVRSAALELASSGITVNAVSPGLVDTRMTRALVEHPVHGPEYLSHIPIGRFGAPSDIGAAVAYLVSPDAGWITGQNIVLDGGQTLGVDLDPDAIGSPA